MGEAETSTHCQLGGRIKVNSLTLNLAGASAAGAFSVRRHKASKGNLALICMKPQVRDMPANVEL